jgi:hypothetical protein
MFDVRVSDCSSDDPRTMVFEMPKSRTFTERLPSALRVKNRFSGFRSRCTMPRACASATASIA